MRSINSAFFPDTFNPRSFRMTLSSGTVFFFRDAASKTFFGAAALGAGASSGIVVSSLSRSALSSASRLEKKSSPSSSIRADLVVSGSVARSDSSSISRLAKKSSSSDAGAGAGCFFFGWGLLLSEPRISLSSEAKKSSSSSLDAEDCCGLPLSEGLSSISDMREAKKSSSSSEAAGSCGLPLPPPVSLERSVMSEAKKSSVSSLEGAFFGLLLPSETNELQSSSSCCCCCRR
mmetsp:Transcript_13344/g.33574  ORF Transcript_13344/g.33574 Transcript_13344/m.33574 type:complete len:233 (+) Transcript_13344:1567-2265(+)